MHISKVQDVNVQTERTEDYKAPTEETAWSRIKKALGPIAVVGVVIAKFFANLKFVLLPLLNFFRSAEVWRHNAADGLGLHPDYGDGNLRWVLSFYYSYMKPAI